MQQTEPTNSEDNKHLTEHGESASTRPVVRRGHLSRFWPVYLGLVVVVILALLPPLINVNRFQRRIASSIGGSLGRPVHLDRISLSLFPLPGFEIQNLVVDEDPAFGSEPIIRANTVKATVRLSSLWRRRVEFSTISFTEPSLNLVHTGNGKWNIEGVLLQASHIDAAPTAQRRAGPTPRFPYIEATGARINFKYDQEKMPFSLVESEFALWSPDPNQWRVRLRARPTRTDSSVSDTGTIELEGTLGRGDSLAHIPINIEGQWRDAPLGEASRVLLGSDAGWRGNMALTANVRGTLGESAVTTRLRLIGARRAEFIPRQPLSADVQCFATGTTIFDTYEDVRCSWSPEGKSDSPIVALTGRISDIRHLDRASVQIGTSGIPAPIALDWLRVASDGISSDITASGKLSGSLLYDGTESRQWSGQLTMQNAGLKTAAMESGSLIAGDIQLRLVPAPTSLQASEVLVLSPVAILLGGRDPATLEGHFAPEAYSLHLFGMATEDKLKQFSKAIAPLGQGLPVISGPQDDASDKTVSEAPGQTAPTRVDLTTAGAWSGPYIWQQTPRQTPAGSRRSR